MVWRQYAFELKSRPQSYARLSFRTPLEMYTSLIIKSTSTQTFPNNTEIMVKIVNNTNKFAV